MKYRLLLMISLLVFYINVRANEYGTAIPVAYNTATKEWSVLFGLHQNKWLPFRVERKKGEPANKAAQRALSTGTNNVYNMEVSGVPWKKINNTYYHMVPIFYTPGKELYTKARTKEITDFAWIPVNEILQNNNIMRLHNNKQTPVETDFIKIFQNLWPEKVDELSIPAQQSDSGTWSSYNSQATSWSTIPGALYFYQSNKPYYEFTNFYKPTNGIYIDGKVWPTTEHYYQAMKYINPATQEYIRGLPTPRDAFKYGQKNAVTTPGWIQENKSLEVMRKAVRAKFMQDAKLKKLLLETGNVIIVENAGANDAFFGAGADFLGHNWLGRILMEVRNEINKQGKPTKSHKSLEAELKTLEKAFQQLAHSI